MVTPKIKTIKQFSYLAFFNFGEIIKGNRVDTFHEDNTYEFYNRKGEIMEEGYFKKTSSFQCPEIFHFCKENEKGQIIWEYNYGNDLFGSCPQSVINNSYNNQGKETEKKIYKIDNNISDWIDAVDMDGNIPPVTMTQLNPILEKREEKKYDQIGNATESKHYDENENLTYKESWIYNTKGYLIERVEYLIGGEIDTIFIYIYDESSPDNIIRLIEIRNYDFENISKGKTLFIYDNQGRRIEVKGYNENGIIVNLNLYKYHDYGMSQEVYYLDSDGNLDHKMIYKYNLNNYLIEEGVYNPDGSLYSRDSNIYDVKERLIESRWIEFAQEFVYTSEKYEYDEFNNWIRCIEFDKEVPVKITERELEYFD